MRINVDHTLGDLERDTRRLATNARRDMARVVKRNTEAGNRVGKGIARESAGAHGKHYHKAWTAEMLAPTVGEYGPEAARPQGGMSFEFGSRNQPPHLDLAKSRDIMRPKFHADVDRMIDGWFW